jgi:hypothetical protein
MKQWFNIVASMAVLALAFGCSGQAPTQPTGTSSAAPQTGSANSAIVAVAQSHNSEQVVFSGVAAIGSTFQNTSPVGFWIWCEAESDNPYAHECNGAMYFYALGITMHVSDNEDATSIEEFGDEQYRIRVTSTKDDSIDCTLESQSAPVHGPHNAIHVSCTSPAGAADSATAVVNVTGPGD